MGGFLFLSRITLPGDHRGWEAVHGGTGDLGVPQLHPDREGESFATQELRLPHSWTRLYE